MYTFVAVSGSSIGLLAGGALTEAINWHWIFFINVPIGIATALFAVRLIENRDGIGLGQGADILGAVLITVGLMLGVYTILEVEQQGWGSTRRSRSAASRWRCWRRSSCDRDGSQTR